MGELLRNRAEIATFYMRYFFHFVIELLNKSKALCGVSYTCINTLKDIEIFLICLVADFIAFKKSF